MKPFVRLAHREERKRERGGGEGEKERKREKCVLTHAREKFF